MSFCEKSTKGADKTLGQDNAIVWNAYLLLRKCVDGVYKFSAFRRESAVSIVKIASLTL